MEDCNYLRVVSNVLISGEMPLTENDSELHTDPDSRVASTYTRSRCVQQRQCQEDSNSTTTADIDMYNVTAINDINDHVYTIVNADSELTDSVSMRCKLVSLQPNFACIIIIKIIIIIILVVCFLDHLFVL
jgi:hypothetical protein